MVTYASIKPCSHKHIRKKAYSSYHLVVPSLSWFPAAMRAESPKSANKVQGEEEEQVKVS